MKATMLLMLFPISLSAQHSHGGSMLNVMSDADMRAMSAHMEMTPKRIVTASDSVRADHSATSLRNAIAKYRDVRLAEADGFHMFAPQIKNQTVYHFTKNL